jgi:hypothetical protein
MDEALNQTMLNMEIEQENINTQVDTLTNSAKNQAVDPTDAIDKIYEGTDTTSQLFGLVQQGMSMYTGGDFNAALGNSGLGKYAWGGSGGGSIGNTGYKTVPSTRREATSALLGVQ